jgi:1-acyl-sn-glycerol-3-phosphate acyltransferase
MQFDFSKVKEYKLYQALRWVAVLFCLRYKVTYIGRENIPQDGGFIIACNHQSGVDPIILGRGVKRTIHFMAKEELFENEALGIFIKHMNAFPVRRGQGDTTAVEFAEDIVRNGYILGIFPEGTRSKDFKPARGKSGTALIAKMTGADVLPVSIYTSDRYKKGTRLTVRFGKLIKNEEFCFTEEPHSTKELKDATKRIMGDITSLWEEGHCEK